MLPQKFNLGFLQDISRRFSAHNQRDICCFNPPLLFSLSLLLLPPMHELSLFTVSACVCCISCWLGSPFNSISPFVLHLGWRTSFICISCSVSSLDCERDFDIRSQAKASKNIHKGPKGKTSFRSNLWAWLGKVNGYFRVEIIMSTKSHLYKKTW